MADAPPPDAKPLHPYSGRGQRPYGWFDRRPVIGSLMHEALDEPIPGGARWAYVFGSVLLFLFISQTVTGIFLSLYYAPTADHAHTTVAYIVKEVTGGSFLRSLHAYGSSAVVIVVLLHLTQTFLYGAYKGRREVLWISGCALFGLMLAMAFTGYLLPWDQKAFFATTVGTNMASEVPLIGSILKRFMRGGNEMGTLTLSRFFVAHVFLLPALTAILIVALPFIDRRLERRPWKRPIAVGIYLAILATLITFGWLSKHEDRLDPAIAKQVAKQNEETEQFMREPFEPEAAANALSAPATAPVLDPAAAAGKKIYDGESCDACHGENGVGTAVGPKLAGATAQKPAEELTNLLRHPTSKMIEGEMKPVEVSDDDLKALVAYIKSLK